MTKLKLTEEQVELIDSFRKDEWEINRVLTNHYSGGEGVFGILNNLTTAELARAIFLPGEVETVVTFKKNDFVVWTNPKTREEEVVKLDRPHRNMSKVWWCFGGGDKGYVHEDDLRKTSEEEIFWLWTLKRKFIGDFREGDIYIDKDGISVRDQDVFKMKAWYSVGDFSGLLRVEDIHRFTPEKGENKNG